MKIWIDIESGTYGNAENLVFVEVSDWNNDEFDKLAEMSDADRSEFASDINRIQLMR
jgi:hypothetical protein